MAFYSSPNKLFMRNGSKVTNTRLQSCYVNVFIETISHFHSLVPPSSHRYKEHEDGFMRLQLIRYESVELTEQLMRERGAEGDCSDQTAQNDTLQPVQEDEEGEEEDEEGEDEEEEGRLQLSSSSPGGVDASEDQGGEVANGEGEVNGGAEDGAESVLLVMLKGSSQEPHREAEEEEQEDTVMRRLQDTAQQLGMQVV